MSFIERFLAKRRDNRHIRTEIARLNTTEASMPTGLEIVFYAESKNDWIYFEGLILELLENRNRPIVYLTSSRDDGAFDREHENFHPFYIGDGFARTMLFKSIDCKVFLMTLTDLDQLFLKRSVHQVEYVYLFHAIVSAQMVYREKSFNGYDTFFTVGPHHDREINALHRFYQIDQKKIVPFGYYRLEKLIRENAQLEKRPSNPEKPRILIAPSWGEFSITRTVITPLIEELLKGHCQVTFRPHPMSHRKDPQLLADLRSRFDTHPDVHFDFDIRSSDSLRNADLMISDWSGSAFEFAFGFERPVLFVDTKPKINNGDYDRFQTFMEGDPESVEPIEKTLRTTLGELLDPTRLSDVNDKIRELLSDQDATHRKLMESRDRTIYNLGHSSAIGADYLIKIIEAS